MIEPGLWDMVMRLRSRGISDARVIEAFELAPRSRFVTEPQREAAYDELRLPLPCGQEMLPPLLAAQMLQVADVRPGQKLLLVGLGSGQLAGLAAKMGARVFAVERYAGLLAHAERNLARAGIDSVTSRWGDGRLGWPSQAPFDRIFLTASATKPPKALLNQLAPDGRLVGIIDGQLSSMGQGDATVFFPATTTPLEPGKSASL